MKEEYNRLFLCVEASNTVLVTMKTPNGLLELHALSDAPIGDVFSYIEKNIKGASHVVIGAL